MNKLNIEESIRRSIALETPDLFNKIASEPVTKLPEEDYIVKSQPKRSTSKLHALYTACTSIAILFAICFGLARNYYAVDSIIAIDVNPSVEITLNKSYKVLSVKANNEDGQILIQDKDFKNKSCDAVISDLTESLSSKGYIDQERNSILVSVSNSNEVKADEVKARVVTDIKTTLNKQEIEPVIYNQSITDSNTKELEQLAKKYNISFGKMKLINSLIEKDSSLTIEELASLPISEIPDYAEKRQIQMAEVIACDKGNTALASNDKKVNKKEPKTKAIPTTESSTNLGNDENTTNNSSDSSATTSSNVEANTTPNSSTASSASTAADPTTSETATISEANTAVVIPKTNCSYCSDSCECSYCDSGCKKGCPYCSTNCPNYKVDSTTDNNQTTEDNNNSQDEGYEITEPDDIGTSGSTEQPEDVTKPNIPSDDTEDIETSGGTNLPEDVTTSETPTKTSEEITDKTTTSSTESTMS